MAEPVMTIAEILAELRRILPTSYVVIQRPLPLMLDTTYRAKFRVATGNTVVECLYAPDRGIFKPVSPAGRAVPFQDPPMEGFSVFLAYALDKFHKREIRRDYN